jgi:DNA polymerase I
VKARILPEGATKKSHKDLRNACKTMMLGVGYGMSAKTLAARINAEVPALHFTEWQADRLIYQHKEIYHAYWEWRYDYIETGRLEGFVHTVSGWEAKVRPKVSPKYPNRTPRINEKALGNYPVQGAGSDILRVAAIRLTREGFRVAALIHDAIMVRCKLDELTIGEDGKVLPGDPFTERVKLVMADSAEEVLQCGVDMRIEESWTLYPNRFEVDLDSPKTSGAKLWKRLQSGLFAPGGVTL